MQSSSKLYASAMIVLGGTVLLSVVQLFWRGGLLLYVPGAGLGLHIMHWFGLIASPLGRVVTGLVLIAIAVQYFKNRLQVPVNRAAGIGKVLAVIGLVAGMVFFAWQLMVRSYGPEASIFVAFGPANFWLSFLYAGVALVEGSRVLSGAHAG